MIYIVKTKSNPAYVKIGYSVATPKSRIDSLQTGCPFELEILFVFKGSNHLEKLFHANLERHKVRGEWFHFNKSFAKDLNAIIQMFKPVKADANECDSRAEYSPRPKKKVRVEDIQPLLDKGMNHREVAALLGVSRHTIGRHLKSKDYTRI